jgi:hypothetical protein
LQLDRYRRWLKSRDVVLRHEHKPAEKMFVSYAGQTVSVAKRLTGDTREVQIFVVPGASYYTFAEATWTKEPNNGNHNPLRSQGDASGIGLRAMEILNLSSISTETPRDLERLLVAASGPRRMRPLERGEL